MGFLMIVSRHRRGGLLTCFLFAFLVTASSGCVRKPAKLPMPARAACLSAFEDKFKDHLANVARNPSDNLRLAVAAKRTVEALGYDYDRTFRYFLLDDSLRSRKETLEVWATITIPRNYPEEALSRGIISKQSYEVVKKKGEIAGLSDSSAFFVRALLANCNKYHTETIDLEALRPFLPGNNERLKDPLEFIKPLQEKGLLKKIEGFRVRKKAGDKKVTVIHEVAIKVLNKDKLRKMLRTYDELMKVKEDLVRYNQ